jgi:hypothetical protein
MDHAVAGNDLFYTRRQLARSSAKLPAISGVATIMQKEIGSSYITGLWKDNIARNLWWHTALSIASVADIKPDEDFRKPDNSNLFDFSQLRISHMY